MNLRSLAITTIQTVGLYAAGFIIPFAGQVLALLSPVPIIIAIVRRGRRNGMTALLTSGVLIALLGGWQTAAGFLLTFGLMAVGTAEGVRRGMKPERTALLGGLLPVAVLGLVFAFYFVSVGKNPVAAVDEYLRNSVTEAAKFYTAMGLTDMASMVSSVSDKFVHYLVRLIPGIAISTSVVQAAFCYGVARSRLVRQPGTAPALDRPPFALWHAPDVWVWGLISALAFILVPQETVRLTGWNLAILFGVVYLAQGTAIVDFYLRKAHLKPFVRGLIVALILALPAVVFVVALGIVDVWADIRKVRGPLHPV